MSTYTPYTRPETYFFLLVLVLVGILVFMVFMPFMSMLIVAATLAVVVYPAHMKIVEAFKGRNGLAALTSLLCLVALIILPLFLIAAQVFNETTSAYQHITSENSTVTFTVETLQRNFNGLIERVFPGINIDIRQYVTAGSAWLLQNVGTFFSGTISIGLRLFLGLFALFYFLKDGGKFVHQMENHSPIPREHTTVLLNTLRSSVRSIIGGSIIVAICQGIVSGIGYLFFGIPNPALWGMLTGLSALIPGIGTALVLIPAILYAFAANGLVSGIGLSIWGIAAVGLLDNFISPKIIGRGLKIHPMIILFSIIGGLSFFGPEGFILGPLAVSFFMALLGIYRLMVKTEEKVIREEI